jgi:hypothetical protein
MRGAQSSRARSGEACLHGRRTLIVLQLHGVSDDPCACLLTILRESCNSTCRSATKWLHNGMYGDTTEMRRFAAARAKFQCRDTGHNCAERAKRGTLLIQQCT